MSKHTPGPWRVGKLITNDGQRAIASDGGSIALVTLKSDVPKRKQWESVCEEREANAQLISAAPQLLSACILGVAMLEAEHRSHLESGDDKRRSYCESIQGAIDTLRAAMQAAIAKTEDAQ
jgi:hypothetical protein